MMVLSWCWSPIRQFAAIVYPWRDNAKETVPLPLMRWCMHLLFWTSLLAGLWYLNGWGRLEGVLRSDWPMWHRAWLPLLGLLVYLLGWLSRGLWLSLARDPLPSVWPDLEVAWTEARIALEHAKINVPETPQFLILGPLTRELQTLLESLGASSMSQRGDAPFRVFAHAEAVFVVCETLSQLGMRGQLQAPHASSWAADPRGSMAARLHHLCQLLALDRGSHPPVQGILVVVAYSAMQTHADARKAINETQDDLRVVRQATGLEVPLYFVVSGLSLPTAGPHGQAWFKRFPPLPDLDPSEVGAMLQDGVDWLCRERMAVEALSRFRLDAEIADGERLKHTLRDNIRLYQWLSAVHTWRAQLGQLVVEGTRNDYSEPGMVAGCYFLPGNEANEAGSAEGATELAQALWGDLRAHQQTASWTADRIAAHAKRQLRTWLGYGLGLLGACVVLAGAGGFLALR